MFKRVVASAICAMFLVSCAGVKAVDPMAFITDNGDKENVPSACKRQYESSIPRVAVVNFQNNTTFDYAKMVQANVQGSSQRSSAGGAAWGASKSGAGVVWGSQEQKNFETNSQSIERDINAKLSESVEDSVVTELVSLGGAQIFSRSDMDKIMNEQKFQQSGLADDRTLVNLGKLAGVKFIITGAVNNVNLSYKVLTEAKDASKRLGNQLGLLGQIAGAVAAAGMESQEGWNIATEVTMRIIDVETGEIVLAKKVSGKEIIGKVPYPNYDALIGGVKKAAGKGLLDARPDLSKYFSLKGYIFETRTSPDGKQKVAMINIGSQHGIKGGQKLIVYTFQEAKDPIKGTVSCSKVKLPLELEVTNQVDTESSWVLINGETPALKRIKIGQIVERAPLAGQGTMQKMGY